jgi:hypothetical protein
MKIANFLPGIRKVSTSNPGHRSQGESLQQVGSIRRQLMPRKYLCVLFLEMISGRTEPECKSLDKNEWAKILFTKNHFFKSPITKLHISNTCAMKIIKIAKNITSPSYTYLLKLLQLFSSI